MTVVVDDPASAFVDQNDIWRKFQNAFGTSFSLLQYAPVFRNYVREGILRAYKDGVQYIEIRAILVKVRFRNTEPHFMDQLLSKHKLSASKTVGQLQSNISERFVFSG